MILVAFEHLNSKNEIFAAFENEDVLKKKMILVAFQNVNVLKEK
jgi:hypothetical protein